MKFSPLFLVACGLLSTADLSRAVIVSYTLDPALSDLRIGGTVVGTPLAPQSAGSINDFYSGSITGDLTGGTLTLAGSSSLLAAVNPAGPFTPAPSGPGAENYGVAVSQSIGGGSIAFRSIAFDLPSGTVVSGSPSTAPFQLTAGFADYNIPALGAGAVGTTVLAPASATNTSVGAATISTAGLIETLTIPVSLSYPAGGGVIITFDGTIVATRPVPEPTAAALIGLLGLAGVSTRRRR